MSESPPVASQECPRPASSPIVSTGVAGVSGWSGVTTDQMEGFRHTLMALAAGLIVLVASVYLLREFAGLIQQIVTAVFLTYLLNPIRQWLTDKGLPTWLAITVTLSGLGLTILMLAAVLQVGLADLSTKMPQYLGILNDKLQRWSESEHLPGAIREGLAAMLADDRPLLERNLGLVRSALETGFKLVSNAVVVVIYLIFLMAESGGLRRRIDEAMTPKRASETRRVLSEINQAVSGYLWVKTFVSAIVGVATTLTAHWYQLDDPLVWGMLAFFLNFVPYLGSLVAIVLPTMLALIKFDTTGPAIQIALILFVVHNVVGYVVEPILTGRRLDLSPSLVIISLGFWAWVWGPVGMVLAVPLMSVIKIIMQHMDATKGAATLMSN